MSEEEVRRAEVLSRVKAGQLSQVEAAEKLGLSYRQTKRIYRRYQAAGPRGLVHGNAGRRSNRAYPEPVRQQALRLVEECYKGFGPTLATEHLAEEQDLAVNAETLRRWMLAEGLWRRQRERKPYRKRRPRREHFGELVQMDGSFHAWLEERGPTGCLLNMVDDATGVTLGRFDRDETTWCVADTLRAWVETYGIPRAIYADWKNVFQHQPTARQKREGVEPVTQFGRMCAKLGIELIAANSPRAKGRVERNHGTHQDRLIKKMRLQGITSYEEANRYLEQEYLAQHNGRYAVEPAQPVDFHDPVPRGLDLDTVFCLEQERTVSNDWVVRYQNRCLQLEDPWPERVAAGSKITVEERRDGSLRLVQGKHELRWREIAPPAPKALAEVRRRPSSSYRRTPAPDHPWRSQLLPGKESRGGNDGAMESVENQHQVSLPSHRPLGNSHTARASHIPTAATATTPTHTKQGTSLTRRTEGHF